MIDVEALNRIRSLCASYGATLVAATKTQPAEVIAELHRLAPEAIMGENRVQELLQKYDPAYEWHMIGRLQANKAKYIVDKVSLIHSLDSLACAAEIEKQAAKRGLRVDALAEVNMGGEAAKGGVAPSAAEAFVNSLSDMKHLRIVGIMSVMPRLEDERELARLYGELRKLFEGLKRINQGNAEIKYLSAGMSGDFEIALENGANIVRIGRAILGERQPLRNEDK